MALLAIILASCNGGGGNTDDATPVTTASPEIRETPDNVWLDLLSRVPADQDATYGIVMSDFASFREALDIAQPAHDAPGQEIFDYVGSISLLRDEAGNLIQSGINTPELIAGSQFNADFEAVRTRWGFTIADLDQSLSVLSNDRSLEILRGRFDGAAIGDALRNDAAFANALQVDEQQGVTFYGWIGAPPTAPVSQQEIDAAQRLGLSLAIDENLVYYDRTDRIVGVVNAASGLSPSLTDIDGIRLLAEGLGRYDLYAAGLGGRTTTVSVAAEIQCGIGCPEDTLAAIESELRAQGVLLPFDTYVTGAGRDGEGFYFVAIVLHSDEATAQTNADLLRQRIERGATTTSQEKWNAILRDLEISAEGPLLYLIAHVDAPSLWSQLLFAGNLLLLTED
ncbi:MAG: hypothetical protein WEB04_07810 [Dehalococcoidia bacterium]